MREAITVNGIPVQPMRFIRICDYMESYNPEYVLILSGDHIYKMDYEVMLDFHKANQCGCDDCDDAGSHGGGKPFRNCDCG